MGTNSINTYIEFHKNAWTDTTKRNVRGVLNKYSTYLNGDPEHLLNNLKSLKLYSQRTAYAILNQYWKFTNKGDNTYETWLKKNRLYFKNSYQRKAVGGSRSFREVYDTIQSLPESKYKTRALNLLHSAQRFGESCNPSNSGNIIGKGQKVRPDFRPFIEVHGQPFSYHAFYRWLKKTSGVTPHDLRKLALTRLAEKGATAQDLCEVAGWSSIQTAFIYLQPKRIEQLKEMLK